MERPPMDPFPPDTPDADLVQAIRVSDAAAFKTLYVRYYSGLFRFIGHRIPVSDLAHDLVQDVFVGLWTHRTHLDPNRSIKAYLYRAAHNVTIDYLRKTTLEHAYFTAPSAPNPLTQPDDALKHCVRAAIEELPETLRLVVILHRLEGWTYREIAEMLQTSVKTVEHDMAKALMILREKFEQ